MIKNEASEKYNIPLEILEEYEKWNLCDEEKNVNGVGQYDDSDMRLIGIIMTLRDTGFNNKEIEQYMRLYLKGDKTSAERRRILKQKRQQTLDEIHFQEKRLDTLDYLQYESSVGKNRKE